MKKSCSAKESKVATTQDTENVLNVPREDFIEQLTEEQLLINQKLLESGIEDEGLGWLEKRNIFKTINVSLDTAGSDRLHKSSPRLAKAANSRPANWVESSFEIVRHGEFQNEKIIKTKANKKDSENKSKTPRNSFTVPSCKRPFQETEDVLKGNHLVESNSERLQKDGEINQTSIKPSKKVHSIKVEVEGHSNEECSSVVEGSGQEVSSGKKRPSQPESQLAETPKKPKMEETNNKVSSEETTPLAIELEMEKIKQNTPFKLRDISTIVSECEIRNQRWKETFLKYKCLTRWGMPIVRNCGEKWDGKQIPPKLLHRYQKFLSSNNLTHPVFFPVKSQSCVDLNKLNSEINFQLSGNDRDESEPDFKGSPEGSLIHSEFNRTGVENNLNTSASTKGNTGRMVLRNRNQQKTVISDEEEISSDDSDDWMAKRKVSKKQRANAKNKKATEQTNKQLVLKLERCNINRGNGNEGNRRNGNKNDVGFTGESMMATSAVNQLEAAPDPDTMVCPICSLRFKKQHIESHATECASKTYKD